MQHKEKIALVTGANKGIGHEVARQLHAQGITVYAAARDQQRGQAAAQQLGIRYLHLDVTQPETIQQAAATLHAAHGHLDILVNNAGIVAPGDGPPSTANPAAIRQILEVNFYGVLAVTQALLPLVRNAPSGRIVMVSSGLGSLNKNADPAWPFAPYKLLGYNGSKALLNMLTIQLAWELRETKIKVNTVNPGYTATDLNNNSGTQTVEEGAAEIIRQALAPEDAPTGGFFETGGTCPW